MVLVTELRVHGVLILDLCKNKCDTFLNDQSVHGDVTSCALE